MISKWTCLKIKHCYACIPQFIHEIIHKSPHVSIYERQIETLDTGKTNYRYSAYRTCEKTPLRGSKCEHLQGTASHTHQAANDQPVPWQSPLRFHDILRQKIHIFLAHMRQLILLPLQNKKFLANSNDVAFVGFYHLKNGRVPVACSVL